MDDSTRLKGDLDDGSKQLEAYAGVETTTLPAAACGSAEKQRLAAFGALDARAGLDLLLSAYRGLQQAYPQLTLDVYVDCARSGSRLAIEPAALEQTIAGLKFHPWPPAAAYRDILESAAACVLPWRHGEDWALVEQAHTCGCPLAAFSIPAFTKAATIFSNITLAAELSPAALGSAIEAALCQTPNRSADTFARSRIGFVTTWNQECGLATYAKFLSGGFDPATFLVLAEDCGQARIAPDEDFVRRCWKRGADDLSTLEAVIVREDLKLLYISCQARFFPQPAFTQFVGRMRAQGRKFVVHVHSIFTCDQQLGALLSSADAVVVHNAETKLEAIANGARPDSVHVVPHGTLPARELGAPERRALREKLGIPADEKVLVAFGFIQPHKGMEGVIEAVSALRKKGIAARAYVAGKPMAEDPHSAEYYAQLVQYASALGVSAQVTFFNRFMPEKEVRQYLSVSDAVLMNYRSQHFEASGACAFALSTGAVVATSIAPPFSVFGDAVWHITAGFPAALSLELLVTDMQLREVIKANARTYTETHSWKRSAQRLLNLFRRMNFSPSVTNKENVVEQNINPQPATVMRVLMMNRPNAFTQRGGDTVVMEKLAEGLRARGVEVTFDNDGSHDPSRFDLVHLFNFALPDLTRAHAERAHRAGVPYVVTTLSEDVPTFHNQSLQVAATLIEYVRRGQDRAWFESNRANLGQVTPSGNFQNLWTVQHAAALFSNGAEEGRVLKRDYPAYDNVMEIKLGHEVGAAGDVESFERAHGVKDFVLCVGRFESRKNQLMLLKALEDSEIPVVLCGGGFTYQPEYEQAVRSFRRKGKTIILDRLSPQMLASAYAAARVHVLPSWYELPGLVSLEAAHHSCNIVVGKTGTSPDYFGDKAFYCDPANDASIMNAVLAAYYSPLRPGLQELAMSYTWEKTAEATMRAYRDVLVRGSRAARPVEAEVLPAYTPPAYALEGDFETTLERGEAYAMNEDYAQAHEYLARAEKMNARSARALKARGTVFLAQGKTAEARAYFARALAIDPSNARSLSGLGMCAMWDRKVSDAYQFFVQALNIDCHHLSSILQLIECAYTISKFDDLERILQRYSAAHPEDAEMRFCLAGCLYKNGQPANAEQTAREVLRMKPGHVGATELLDVLAKQQTAAPAKRPEQRAGTAFDDVDREIQALEDAKRERNLSDVRAGCARLEGRGGLRDDQREKITLLRAEVSVLENDLAGARELYDAVLSRNPASPRGLCGKGALAAHAGRWDEARAHFEQALRARPDYDVALAGLGLCSSWFKDHERAWEYYRSAIKINPENARALLGVIELGYPLQRLSDVEDAVRAYLDMHPADFEFLYALAGCLFAQGKLGEAVDELNKITVFDPANQRALELKKLIDERQSSPVTPLNAATR